MGLSGVREGVRVRVSEAMNYTAFAFVVLLPVAVVVAVGWWRKRRKAKSAVRPSSAMAHSAEDVERELLRLFEHIRSGTTNTGSCCLASFPEAEDGYKEVDEVFASAVSVGTRLWGTPAQNTRGPAYVDSDILGVPGLLWDRRTLHCAWWRTPGFSVSITIDTHDADSLRTINLWVADGI